MAEKTGQVAANNFGIPNLMPTDFCKLGKERTDVLLAMQKEIVDAYEQANRSWFARVKSEADLRSVLATKLTSTRSVPEAVGAFQQCTSVPNGSSIGST